MARFSTPGAGRAATLLAIACLCSLSSCACQDALTDAVPGAVCEPAAPAPEPRARLSVRALDDRTLVVVTDPTDWLRSRVVAECTLDVRGPGMASIRQRYAAKETLARNRPVILRSLSDADHFVVDGPSGAASAQTVAVWPQAVREMRLPTTDEATSVITDAAEVVYFSYVRPSARLLAGQTYTVRDAWGGSASTTFDVPDSPSWAIKVDQVGYVASAPRKYAFIGAWLGQAGALDLDRFAGATFTVVRADDNGVALSGTIEPRPFNDTTGAESLIGERVMELDLSKVTTPGSYRVHVDGVGHSIPFRVSEDALGEAFHTHARGLYHARCDSLSAAYTAWSRGDRHGTTRRGAFPPDVEDYADHTTEGWGFFTEYGEYAPHTSFEMVRLTATTETLPGVRGGWHDAADFDRRTMHLGIVGDLAHTYLFHPAAFTDGQLDIPESGNGIPDILDEARWGILPLLRGQGSDGGVGTWIETTSHPKIPDPGADTQPYYLSLATRNSSLLFAAEAALLSRAFRAAGRTELADELLDSARRAHAFGSDPTARVKLQFDVSGATHVWIEPPLPDPLRRLRSAIQLWLASRDQRYRDELGDPDLASAFDREIADAHWRRTSFQLTDVALADPADLPEGWAARARARVVAMGDDWISWQDADPYRKVWYPPSHAYFRLMGWGQSGFAPMKYLVAAHRVTGDEKYRAAALVGIGWMQGINPQGRTTTTGLGRNHPVAVLHLPSSVDGRSEPVPGITTFGYTGLLPLVARTRVYGTFEDARPRDRLPALALAELPPPWNDPSLTGDDIRDVLARTVPLWRRLTSLENQVPPVNEFSVHETIGPAVAVTGYFLADGWTPTADLRGRRPRSEEELRDALLYQP